MTDWGWFRDFDWRLSSGITDSAASTGVWALESLIPRLRLASELWNHWFRGFDWRPSSGITDSAASTGVRALESL